MDDRVENPMNHPADRHPSRAWLSSAVVHATALTLLVLFWPSQPVAGPNENDRTVGIALKPRTRTEAKEKWQPSAGNTSESKQESEKAGQSDALPSAEDVAETSLDAGLPDVSQHPGVYLSGDGPGDAIVLHRGGRPMLLPGFGDEEILRADALRNQPAGPSGPKAVVRLFGTVAASGRSFVFVIDRSKSMGGAGLGAISHAQKELLRELDRLTPEQTFQIVAYNHRRTQMSDRSLLPASEENVAAAEKFLSGIAANGPTEHDLALLAALRGKPDVIFLLTDGGDPFMNAQQIRTITTGAAGRTEIHCIHFGFGPPRDDEGARFLQKLARLNDGIYGYVDMSQRR
jgi:hypothetical protein